MKAGRSQSQSCGDSKLASLPAERQAAIAEYGQSHTLEETADWLADQGIRLSHRSIAEFLTREQLTRQLQLNALTVETLIGALAKQERELTPERLQLLGQAFFTELALAKGDPRLWYLAQQIELKRERLQLDWQKYREQVETRKAVSQPAGGAISPETLDKIEREIKLM